MEIIDLVPNALTFKVITTIDIVDEAEIPTGYTGRVRRHENDALAYVAWYVDGRLQNPGRHHPAYRRLRADGRVKYELFYEDGELHDPAPNMPAVRGFYADGSPHYEERYRAGRRWDGRDGSPAIRKWRADGSLRHELHYRDGRRVPDAAAARPPRAGTPGRQESAAM
jgi:hypothetical protein